MHGAVRPVWMSLIGAVLVGTLGGCPTQQAAEFISGGTGSSSVIRTTAEVTVLTPAGNLSIIGGTQVEVNWQAFAKSSFATLDVIIDPDLDPNNGNETAQFSGLALTQSKVLLDTTFLLQGSYHVGVVERELGTIVAFGYAPGTITIDQAPRLFFVETDASRASRDIYSARDNVTSDRSARINLTFDIAWDLIDPDSQNTVEILLDPDTIPNGNEVALYQTSSQEQAAAQAQTPPVNKYQFRFDLPTKQFAAGTYHILAVVSDGVHTSDVYAPGSIRLRERLAGPIDLRDLDVQGSGISGAVFEGFNPRDNAGSFVSSAGDLDADGFSDFLINSQFGKPQYFVNIQRTGIGEAYLIYGRQRRFSGVNNLNSTGVLYRGDVFTGVPELPDPIRPSRGITSFAALSDWDGDGWRELAFGLPFTDSLSIMGWDAAEGLGLNLGPSQILTACLDNDGAFRTGGVVVASAAILRPSAGFPGAHVINLGTVGQVAYSPYVPSAPCAEGFYGVNIPGSVGCTLFNKHRCGVSPELPDESRLPGCRILTNDFGDQCGEAISSYTSNGILISVPNRDPIVNTAVGHSVPAAGVVSLYFGGNIWASGNAYLPHKGPYRYILDDQRVFPACDGGIAGGTAGYWVDPEDGAPCEMWHSLDTPIPERTVRVYGGTPGARIGGATRAGDFNADGLEDFLVGSPLSNEGAGACFIILGRLPALVIARDVAVEELGLPMHSSDPLGERVFDGIRVVGAPNDRLGQSQAMAGDFNNDGIADVIIGSPQVNDRKGGAAVFFGSRTVINLTQLDIPFNEIPTRGLGVIFEGEEPGDMAGARVADAGDVDGDGNTDILIAAPNRSVHLDLNQDGYAEIDRTHCGVVYLIYGSPDLLRSNGDGTFSGTYSLADVGTTKLPGAVFIGRESEHYLGAGLGEQGDTSVGIASAGDVDGDGKGDILLSAVKASPRDRAAAGETYLLYGN
jgi:hypothetical protein